jgi:hypothetical protein
MKIKQKWQAVFDITTFRGHIKKTKEPNYGVGEIQEMMDLIIDCNGYQSS